MAAGEVPWTGHIENLVPGVLLTMEFGVLSLYPSQLPTTDTFVFSTGFVAASYAIGLLDALAMRAVVDSISERRIRWLVFRTCAHGKREKLVELFGSGVDKNFISDVQSEVGKGRSREVAEWNAIYREALRRGNKTRREEIDRRRSLGRIVRSLFLPAILGPLCGLKVLCSVPGCGLIKMILMIAMAIVAAPIMVFAYAYAEYNNVAEALDIAPEEPPQPAPPLRVELRIRPGRLS